MTRGSDGRVEALRHDDPRSIGRYRLVGRLGSGGMGTVYLGLDRNEQPVAVKVIRPHLAADEVFRARFRAEVRRVRQVPPFCTAAVLDADPDHERPYLVVEYVDAPSLEAEVERRGPLRHGNLHGLAIGVASALSAIHGAGVVHRDLKPANVLLAPGSPKVIDFGIAQALDASDGLTRTDLILGTVSYTAPERIQSAAGVPAGPASDIFSWAGVVTFAGTGQPPYGADSTTATAFQIISEPPRLYDLAPPLRELVQVCLDKDPRNRPTARELLDLLLSSGSSGGYVPPVTQSTGSARVPAAARPAPAAWTTPAPRRNWAKRGLAVTGALAAAAVATAVALVLTDRPPAADAGTGPTTTAQSVRQPGNGAGSGAPAAPARRPVTISDPLTAPGRWSPGAADGGSCSFTKGVLYVQQEVEGALRCPGPADRITGDQSVEVDIVLLRAGSCAAIWFLAREDSGYEYRVCEGTAQVHLHRPDVAPTVVGSTNLAEAVERGVPTRIGFRLTGSDVELRRDNRSQGKFRLPDASTPRPGETVTLGIAMQPGGEAPYAVAFRQVEIRTY
ncbi:hypothetical protein Val02_33870 [Virgisporangium aliadipatigenens]|uniref:Protein kinase domain-containing protein n=1 Tax=Virgisporangium aliadipatigenens TaxID=741659 RepID=A0A8J3YJV9_9ACTN|nr:serine/threonine-protein kinase [Virgisporangium aliadipatigenens]GIJ46501.1 hypothetical protein Val02_33870 [Virgisporangium aliadipatigenens]